MSSLFKTCFCAADSRDTLRYFTAVDFDVHRRSKQLVTWKTCSVEADMCPITNGGSVLVKGNFVSICFIRLLVLMDARSLGNCCCAHLNDSDLGRPKCVSTVYYSNKKKEEHVKHAQTQMYVTMLTILCYILGNASQLYYRFC